MFYSLYDIQMSTTVLVATLLAPVFVLVTLTMFINPDWVGKIAKEYSKSAIMAYVLAVIQVVYGTIIIHYHNVWTWDWSLLITILGWGAMIKGVLCFLVPAWWMNMVGSMKLGGSNAIAYGVACAAMSLILIKIAYMG